MTNIGNADRITRFVAGIVLIALPFITSWGLWATSAAKWGVPLVGLVLLLTAIFSFCPAYRLVGMNTCGLKR